MLFFPCSLDHTTIVRYANVHAPVSDIWLKMKNEVIEWHKNIGSELSDSLRSSVNTLNFMHYAQVDLTLFSCPLLEVDYVYWQAQ